MAIKLLKGQTINGQWFNAFDVVTGLDPDKEAALIQGGGAVSTPSLGASPAFWTWSGTAWELRDPAGNQVSGAGVLSVTGNSSVGSVLTAALATGWLATGYQWQRSTTVNATGVTTTADIAGATSSTYTLAYSDGSTSTNTVRVSCKVTGLTYFPTGKQIDVVVGAAPAWLIASTRNKYPKMRCQTTTGGGTGILSRFPVTIGSGDPTKLRFSFSNAYISTTGELVDTSTVLIDEVAIERVSNSTAAAVTFSGGRTLSLAAGQVDIQTDDILPSVFGLSKFTKGEQYYIKVKAHVAASGDYFPGSRQIQEGGTQRAWRYAYGSGTVSAAETFGNFTSVSGTPAIGNEGTGGNSQAFCPMVIGYFDNGDTKTFGVTGDSIIDGTSSPNDGTFIQYACNTAAQGPYAMFEVSAGGTTPANFNSASTLYRTLFKYCRIHIDELGTNGPGQYTDHLALYTATKTQGVKKIYKTKLLPRTYSTCTTTSLTNVGTTATLTPNVGALPAVGISIQVSGATPAAYNGTFTVTRSGSGSFDYTMASDPGASATGTIYWSDKWTTEANQQYVQAPGGPNDLENIWAQARVADGTLAGVLALAEAFGTDAFKWKGGSVSPVGDSWSQFGVGTHPTTATNTAIAAGLAPQLDAMTV